MQKFVDISKLKIEEKVTDLLISPVRSHFLHCEIVKAEEGSLVQRMRGDLRIYRREICEKIFTRT